MKLITLRSQLDDVPSQKQCPQCESQLTNESPFVEILLDEDYDEESYTLLCKKCIDKAAALLSENEKTPERYFIVTYINTKPNQSETYGRISLTTDGRYPNLIEVERHVSGEIKGTTVVRTVVELSVEDYLNSGPKDKI